MSYENYLSFLLDIRTEFMKYKTTRPPQCRYFTGDQVGSFIETITHYLDTPSKELGQRGWFDIGWILAQFFGEKAIKMVYGNKFICKECENHDKPPKRSKETNTFYR